MRTNVPLSATERVILFEALQREVAWLQSKWLTYQRLYASDQDTVDLLNWSAPWFFVTIQQVLQDDIVLGLARLTENEIVSRRETLVLRALPTACDPVVEAETIRSLNTLIAAAESLMVGYRRVRNERLAHTSRAQTVNPFLAPLPRTTDQEVSRAFEAVFAVMTAAAPHFGSVPENYALNRNVRGAEALLSRLESARVTSKR